MSKMTEHDRRAHALARPAAHRKAALAVRTGVLALSALALTTATSLAAPDLARCREMGIPWSECPDPVQIAHAQSTQTVVAVIIGAAGAVVSGLIIGAFYRRLKETNKLLTEIRDRLPAGPGKPPASREFTPPQA